MNEHHILDLLDNVIEGTLKPEQRQFIELHITQCPECKSEFDRLNAFMSKIDALPKEIQPPRDLWSGIEKRITTQPRGTIIELPGHQYEGSVEQQKAMRREIQQGIVRRSVWYFRAAAVALLFIISAALYWYLTLPELPSWQVTTLEGKPKIGSELLAATGKLYIGDLLETDNASRAKLTVGKIGEVELEPNTKLRLLNTSPTDHRLSLDRGTIHASVSAPPRLFVVETPSATAVDLGCVYTLTVDSLGASKLYVITGWVSFEHGGIESIVPQGAECITKPGIGPGTPFRNQCSSAFESALYRFDFERGGSAALDSILPEAVPPDAISLWHLLYKTTGQEKEKVYDKLAFLVPPPLGVTREGVIQGDKNMLKLWKNHLNLNPYAIVPEPVDAVP